MTGIFTGFNPTVEPDDPIPNPKAPFDKASEIDSLNISNIDNASAISSIAAGGIESPQAIGSEAQDDIDAPSSINAETAYTIPTPSAASAVTSYSVVLPNSITPESPSDLDAPSAAVSVSQSTIDLPSAVTPESPSAQDAPSAITPESEQTISAPSAASAAAPYVVTNPSLISAESVGAVDLPAAATSLAVSDLDLPSALTPESLVAIDTPSAVTAQAVYVLPTSSAITPESIPVIVLPSAASTAVQPSLDAPSTATTISQPEIELPTAAASTTQPSIDAPSAATAAAQPVISAPSAITAVSGTATTPPFPLNHARILYENVLQGYNSITDTGPTGTAINAIKPNTWERWKFSTAANTLIVDFSTAVDFDTVCIASHNLSNAGATIAVYYEPEPGGVFLELDTKTPTNNEPICFYSETLLDALTIEIRITGASGVPQIGYISAGESLQMQRPFFNGHIPITDGDVTEYYSNRTESGEIIGQQIRRQGYQTSADWRYIDDTWYRNYFDPFKKAAKLTPFFFMWNLLEYPDDVGFCRISQDINCPMQNGFTTKRTISMTLLGAG